MPVIMETVMTTIERSEWPLNRILTTLGLSRSTFYRWLRFYNGRTKREPDRRFNAFETLSEEKEAVIKFADEHPEMHYRELAYRMLDAGIAALDPSTVYRVLDEAGRMQKRVEEYRKKMGTLERATHPNEVWASDYAEIRFNGRKYFLIFFIDEYSRYIVYFELAVSMDGNTTGLAFDSAMSKLPAGTPSPKLRSDNGSGFISHRFRRVLREWEVEHLRITPHCPAENGVAERWVSTLRDMLALQHEPVSVDDLVNTITEVVRVYNEERLHSSLFFLTPSVWYRGNPGPLLDERRRRMAFFRERRKSLNLGRKQTRLMGDGSYEPRDQSPRPWKLYGNRGVDYSQSA